MGDSWINCFGWNLFDLLLVNRQNITMKLLATVEDLPLIAYSVYEVSPKVYAVHVIDDYSRAMLFLRAQEYYESPYPEFRGRKFNVFDYMNRYRTQWNKAVFSYTEDWMGYNVPSTSIEQCYGELDHETDMITPYDHNMMNVLWYIRKHQPRGKFYLLGVDSLDSWVMNHEMAHALFFTNPEYKKEMMELLIQMPSSITDKLNSHLLDEGYTESVLADEAHAYLATGLQDEMVKIKGIKTWAKKFSTIFKKYHGKHINKSRAKLKTTEAIG